MAVATDKARRDLEYARLKARVKEYAQSALGEEEIDTLAPIADRAELEREIAAVEETRDYLIRGGRLPFGGIEDLRPYFARARSGIHLDGEEFLAVAATLDTTAQLRDLLSARADLPYLRRLGSRLSAHTALAKRIYRTIDDHGDVRSDASPRLAALTAHRRVLEDRLTRKLRAFMSRNPELVSDPVITRRQGRLVVPVKSGAVGAMEFVVHDRSATGQTLYAEPTAVVQENNAIAAVEAEIHQETARLLRELTAALLDAQPGLERDRAILGRLDSLVARAAYGIAHHCAFPQLSDAIDLLQARHPLIPEDQVVPISVSVGKEARALVITGPNTGGKTVTLRTIGLLTLMTQSAIPIPAAPDSKIAVVARVRTDIGDEQSLAQNLSTFSAHMGNIVSILNEVDSDALVLLDELGAGTDPQEGAALGLAVLEELLARGTLVVVSTHLTPLKYFAIRHPRVKTASMEFDPVSLAPTFHLIEGIPGRSNAFIIARNLGLDPQLVEQARAFLSRGEIRADDIIDQLQRERQAMVSRRHRAEEELARATTTRRQYEQKLARFEAEKEADVTAGLRDLDAFIKRTQAEVEQLLAVAKSVPTRDELRTVHRRLAELRAAMRARADAAYRTTGADSAALSIGDYVHVRGVDVYGDIVALEPDKGEATIDVDGKHLRTRIEILHPAPRPRSAPRWERTSVPRPSGGSISLQLNVRQMTVAAALREVERYLDRLLLADVRRASILHGKGSGALRDAIRNYLASCAFVKNYGPAPPAQGGDGVTVFELSE